MFSPFLLDPLFRPLAGLVLLPVMSISPILLDQVFTRKLFAIAGSSILLYDYLITLSLEVAYIWNAPWTIVKALFLINRYGNLIGQTFVILEETGHLNQSSQEFCVAFELYCVCFAIFSGESIRLLVVMRACAILGCRHSIAVLASILYTLCAIVILGVSLYWMRNINLFHFEYLNETGICIAPVAPDAWLLWFIPLFLDGLVLVTICCSLYQLTGWSHGHFLSPLIRLLARDSFLFYSAALFNVLFFIVCWNMFGQDPRNNIPAWWSLPILSVIGQRLVLNIRRLRARPDSTRDVSREVHRQMAAMGSDQLDHQSDAGLELNELGGERAEV